MGKLYTELDERENSLESIDRLPGLRALAK